MKQPRIDAFVSKPVKALASPLDGLPAIESPREKSSQNKVETVEATTARPTDPLTDRSIGRIKRTTVRRAFEYFQDQLDTLHKFSLEEKMRGEVGNMSQMVREAIDNYIAKRLNRTDQE